MLKVTIKLTAFLFFYCVLGVGCVDTVDNEKDKDAALQMADSLSEAKIDSAYIAIKASCDTLRIHMVPRFVDSLAKGDTAYMDSFFDSKSVFIDSNKKVERIVRLLQAECDSDLRKEAFKRMSLLNRPNRLIKGKR